MYVDYACRALLGLVFTVAVLGKVRHRVGFNEFVQSLRQLGVRRYATALAFIVVAGEATVVTLLAVPVTTLAGYGLSAAMLMVFIAAIVMSMATRRSVRCACFGGGGQQLGVTHVVRNGLLTVVAGVGATATQLSARGPVTITGLAIATVAGLLLATLFIRWDDLTYLLSSTPTSPGWHP